MNEYFVNKKLNVQEKVVDQSDLWYREGMTKEDQEPIERLEEIIPHPADKTFNSLHDRGLSAKKELTDERHELGMLVAKLPKQPPKKGSKDYEDYLIIQKEIQSLREKVSKKHDELMEILKNEEKICREMQERQP